MTRNAQDTYQQSSPLRGGRRGDKRPKHAEFGDDRTRGGTSGRDIRRIAIVLCAVVWLVVLYFAFW